MGRHPLAELFNTEPKVEIQSHIDGVKHPKRVYEATCCFGRDLGGGCYYNVTLYGFGTTEDRARTKLGVAAIALRNAMTDAVGAEIL